MINTEYYIEHFLKIRDKKAEIIPLKMNAPQRKLYEVIKGEYKKGKPIRIIILKARQMGFSTLTEAILFKETATEFNVSTGVVAHEISATNNLFNMFKRYYDNLPKELQPQLKASNAKEVVFDGEGGLGSSIKCMTAGNDSIGRSDTFQKLHVSEYAFWKGDKESTLTGLLQAVPNLPETIVIIESTANGYDDFKDMWDKAVSGENDFVPVFCAWHELEEYRMEYTGFELTEDELELKRLYNLDNEQIAWRRWCIRNNCKGKVEVFRQEYPSSPQDAFISSGRSVFNLEKISRRIDELKGQTFKECHFNFTWRDPDLKDKIVSYELAGGGDIRIYQDVQKGVPYVIGADTKGEGRDYFAATVINNNTGERVATYHTQLSNAKPFTYQLYCLGKYYNDALISVEINFNTMPVEELSRLKYPRQYVRRKYDNLKKEIEMKLGWKTDGNTRPYMIDEEIGLVEENIDLFNDVPTLMEMLTFMYDEKGRPDALSGKHDDLIFSDMIANRAREQQRFDVEIEDPKAEKRVYYTDEMMKDYEKGTDDEKKLMRKLWGNPFKRKS